MLISIVIPNWNGSRLLPTCLNAIKRQSLQPSETIVVDNGSTDESLAVLESQFPWVHVIGFANNRGFAAAVNEGIRQSQGDAVVLLNNDTEADPDWLAALAEAATSSPGFSSFASALLLFDRRTTFHSAGDYYAANGVPGNRGVWEENQGQFDSQEEVFGACAAAALYRRGLFEEVGLFDEGLGSYCEDVDLSFRAQLAGHHCLFVPKARVYHRLSASGAGPLASYNCGRNSIVVLYKNMPAALLRKHALRIVSAQLSFAQQSLVHWQEPAARARLRGQAAGIAALLRLRGTRQRIQRSRRVTLTQLDSMLTRSVQATQ